MNKHSNRVKSFFDIILILFWIISGGGVLFVLVRNVATCALFLYIGMLLMLYRPKIRNLIFNSYIYTILLIIFCLCVCYIFAVQPQDIIKYIYILIVFIISGIICIYFFASFTYSEFIKLFY